MRKESIINELLFCRSGILSKFITIFVFFIVFLSTSSARSYDIISGILPEGAPWAMATPTPPSSWNGTLILDFDGNCVSGSRPISAAVKWFIAHGYAYGGTTRTAGDDYLKAADYLAAARDCFISQKGKPLRTIYYGGSGGNFVGRKCMEVYPDIFDGALLMNEGGAGQIAKCNMRLDMEFVLKVLVNPSSPLKLVGIASMETELAALTDLFNLAQSTPEGQARLALAAAFAQISPWTVPGTPEPSPQDYEAQYIQLISISFFGMPTFIVNSGIDQRANIEKFSGGVFSWNHGVDYTDLLVKSGRYDFVKYMYKKAGLDLMADLGTLRDATRIAADPAAVAIAEKRTSYSGRIKGPILNIDDIGQPVDSQSGKLAYLEALRKTGNENLFRIVWVRRAGHGAESDLEQITAFTALINRLDTGEWGDTSANGMNTLARKISGSGEVFPDPKPLFMDNNPPGLLRPWDGSDWGSYKPCEGYEPDGSSNLCR